MPVTLEWNTARTVLLATYAGVLTGKDHEQMASDRLNLIEDAENCVVLLADMRRLEGLRDSDTAERHTDVLRHQKVVQTLIVVDPVIYWQVARAQMDEKMPGCRVRFYEDFEQAAADAETTARHTTPWAG